MKNLSWSKILLLVLFINFFILEIFIGFTTLKMFAIVAITQQLDFTPLITLIGAVIGQTISYGIYVAKSKAENSKNGITYDLAMREFENNNNNNEEEENYG